MNDYLSKPYKAADLVAIIERVLSNGPAKVAEPVGDKHSDKVEIDWDQAFDTVGGDRKLLLELIGVFVTEQPKMLSDLKSSIEAKNLESAQRFAHSLKGTLSHLGASKPAETARKIEFLSDDDWPAATAIYGILHKQVSHLMIEFENYTRSQSVPNFTGNSDADRFSR